MLSPRKSASSMGYLTSQGLVKRSWKEYFRDPSQWSDNRRSKKNPGDPDFRHKITNESLWMDGIHTPNWVHDLLNLDGEAEDQDIVEDVCSRQEQVFASLSVPEASNGFIIEKNVDNALILCQLIEKRKLNLDLELGNSLIFVFVDAGRILEAQDVFNRMQLHDSNSWNCLIQGYLKFGQPQESLDLYQKMQEKDESVVKLSCHSYVALLKACAQLRDLKKGSELHVAINGLELIEKDVFIRSSLIDMYGKCCSLSEAQRVFGKISMHDVVSWTALIGGYVEQGCAKDAIGCFRQMQQEGIIPDSFTYVYILKACGILGPTKEGRMLVKEVFERIPVQQTIFWNALISGYVEYGHVNEALNFSQHMQERGISLDSTSFICLLKACSFSRSFQKGQILHAEVCKLGLENKHSMGSALVDFHAKCGFLEEAHYVFVKLPVKEIISWNSLITGFIEHGYDNEVLEYFEQMQNYVSPDSVTYLACLKACASTRNITRGHEIHANIAREGLEVDLTVGSSLIDMYSKFGLIARSYVLFENLPLRDTISWNTLITGYLEQGHSEVAINFFEHMQLEGLVPHALIFISILKACGRMGSVSRGEEVHADIVSKGLEDNVLVGSTLVDMYAKCGLLETAQKVFEGLPNQDVVAWNVLISGFTEYGCAEAALDHFLKMQRDGIPPDEFTFSSVLKSCATQAISNNSQELHAEIMRKGLEKDLVVGSTLIDAYSKSGSTMEAYRVFTFLPARDVVAWTTLMGGYGLQLGDTECVINVLSEMIREGIKPSLVTLVTVINACSHAGLISEAEMHFNTIGHEYDLIHTREHFACMIDLLGRSGHVDMAIALIMKMPFHPTAVVWHSVLGACRKWGYLEIGKLAFEHALSLDEMNTAAYVCMANIYAECEIQDSESKNMPSFLRGEM